MQPFSARVGDKNSTTAAIAACDRAIYSKKFSGRDLAYLYNDRGFHYMTAGDLGRARADLDRAIQIDPELYQPYCNRAEICAAGVIAQGPRPTIGQL